MTRGKRDERRRTESSGVRSSLPFTVAAPVLVTSPFKVDLTGIGTVNLSAASRPSPPNDPWWRSNKIQNRWQAAAIVAVVAYVVCLVAVPHTYAGRSTPWLSGVGALAVTLPTVPILVRVRKVANMRAAWSAIGVGAFLLGVGIVLQLLQLRLLSSTSGLTIDDGFHLLSYLAFAVGVTLMAQQSFGLRAISVRLDSLIIALALGALVSITWFERILEHTGRTLLVELNLVYPIVMLSLLVLLLAGLVPRRLRVDASYVWLIVGLGVLGVGDSIQLNTLATNAHVPRAIAQASWPLGLSCIALAAWPRTNRLNEVPELSTPQRGLVLIPAVFGVLSTMLLTLSLLKHASSSTSYLALTSLALVILRMQLSHRELQALGLANFGEARTDHVTGLHNRRAFLEDGSEKFATLRPSQRLGIALIDLDGFKEVNDSIGHAYGDELLRTVGKRFAAIVANRGFMARIGGDEFAYTFVIEAGDDPVAFANDLARTLTETVSLGGTKVRVGASIGVAVSPVHGRTHHELLRSADVAMYEAKRSRSVVCLYRDEIDLNSRERLSLTDELRNAIERRHLVLHYQPTLDLCTGEIRGVEALVRWAHPTRGLLYPDDFIPLAERVGLIIPLTRSVLELAIAVAGRLNQGDQRLQMSVNISQWDLVDEQLPDSIDRMLKWYGVSSDRVTLEVTESSLANDPARAKQNLNNLRARGLLISIDDFGVGYSSLSQLLELPVDELKIDKSFIEALSFDDRAIALIQSTVEMARALKLTVVAEGIESRENLESLRSVGADFAQGNFVSRPLTERQLVSFLSRSAGQRSALTPRENIAAASPEQTIQPRVTRLMPRRNVS